MMNIFTERCEIRDFRPEDIDRFMEYRNDMDWMRYQGYKGKPKKTYEEDLIQNTSIEKGLQLALIDRTTTNLIGDIYIKQENDTYWLGYTVHPAHARKGYVKEAVSAMIKWINGQGGTEVKAGVVPENTASISLLEELGFIYTCICDDERIYIYEIFSQP